MSPSSIEGGGRITLTPGGAALMPFAEQMKTLGEDAVAAVAGAYGQEAGELGIGASQTIGQYLLPTFIAGFRQAHPQGTDHGFERQHRSYS